MQLIVMSFVHENRNKSSKNPKPSFVRPSCSPYLYAVEHTIYPPPPQSLSAALPKFAYSLPITLVKLMTAAFAYSGRRLKGPQQKRSRQGLLYCSMGFGGMGMGNIITQYSGGFSAIVGTRTYCRLTRSRAPCRGCEALKLKTAWPWTRSMPTFRHSRPGAWELKGLCKGVRPGDILGILHRMALSSLQIGEWLLFVSACPSASSASVTDGTGGSFWLNWGLGTAHAQIRRTIPILALCTFCNHSHPAQACP